MFGTVLVVVLALGGPPSRAAPPDQNAVIEGIAQGRYRPFPEIVRSAQRRVFGGTLIGSDFDRGSGTYRLKFMAQGQVFAVVVDATSAEVIEVEGR